MTTFSEWQQALHECGLDIDVEKVYEADLYALHFCAAHSDDGRTVRFIAQDTDHHGFRLWFGDARPEVIGATDELFLHLHLPRESWLRFANTATLTADNAYALESDGQFREALATFDRAIRSWINAAECAPSNSFRRHCQLKAEQCQADADDIRHLLYDIAVPAIHRW